MRRALITTAGSVAGIVLLLSLKPHDRPMNGATAAPREGGSTASAGPLSDGTYQGRTVDTRYGPVQVEITVSGGRLTGVHVLRVPSENGRDREIAAFSVPRLTREALASGDARIDAVSGATYTSEGYISSLQSALDRAHG